jgi:hypothetical protein
LLIAVACPGARVDRCVSRHKVIIGHWRSRTSPELINA